MENNINLTKRKSISYVREDHALTFFKPFSSEHENHLFVIYEDAYGDTSNGLMHRKTIQENYSMDEEILIEIFKKLRS